MEATGYSRWFERLLTELEISAASPIHNSMYIDIERREEERKKLGLPSRVIGSILPHSAVAQAEERWEAEQERKRKRPRKPRK